MATSATPTSTLTIKQQAEQVGIGTMVVSVDSTTRSPCIVFKGTGVSIHSNNPGIGIYVDDSGISFQGKISYLSSGTSVAKGNYTENNNSYKPYTYTETIQAQASIQQALYTQLAAQGVDTSTFNKTGVGIPLITDIAAGPLPHVHTISLKHVHAIEPAYLYKMSPLLTSMKGALSGFQSFLAL